MSIDAYSFLEQREQGDSMEENQFYVETLEENQLIELGFSYDFEYGHWFQKIDLSEKEVQLQLKIKNNQLSYQVMDTLFHDLWLPYYQNIEHTPVHDEVLKLLLPFKEKNGGMYDKINALITTNFEEILVEQPWESSPKFTTYKAGASKKWFALLMDIEADKLGLEESQMIDVLNIKLPPEDIKYLVDQKVFFPAYHMNKKHWISVYLNQVADEEQLLALIKKSYLLVTK